MSQGKEGESGERKDKVRKARHRHTDRQTERDTERKKNRHADGRTEKTDNGQGGHRPT